MIGLSRSNVCYTYDAESRITKVISPSDTLSFSFDALTGQMLSAVRTDTVGVSDTLEYQWRGALPVGTLAKGGVPGSVALSYDSLLQVASLNVAGTRMQRTRDRDGLLLTNGELTITREATSGWALTLKAGQVQESRTYSSAGLLAKLVWTNQGVSLREWEYSYDKIGRITSILETNAGKKSLTEYSYNIAGRLVGVIVDGVVQGDYTFDANGNRTVANGQLATFAADDRLLQAGGKSYSYNGNGALASVTNAGATSLYNYDVRGNLLSAVTANGTQITYRIDARDRRIGKAVNGVAVEGFLYKDQLEPIAWLDGQRNVKATFVYGDRSNVPAYMTQNSVNYRYITDHLGSVRMVVNASTGAILQEIDYDAWGVETRNTNPGFQPFGFAGGITDSHTGLVRFGARDYDPATGRWTAKDPIRFDGGFNLYGYCDGDPVNWVDVSGENPLVIVGAIIGAGVNAYANWGRLDGAAYIASIAGGAVIGGLAGLAPGLIAGSAAGGVASGLNELMTQSLEMMGGTCKSRKNIDAYPISQSAMWGMAGGAMSGLGSIVANRFMFTPGGTAIGASAFGMSEDVGGIVGNFIGTLIGL